MRAVLLHDAVEANARPDERDALVQVEAVGAALEELGVGTSPLPIDRDLGRALRLLDSRRPDFVFNLVESIGGRGRWIHLVPAVLETRGIPYTGASAEALLVTSNKLVAKRLLVSDGLPTPLWVEDGPVSRAPERGCYLIKSVWEDASLGIGDDALVEWEKGADAVPELRDRADGLGGEAFGELYVPGRELNVSLLETPDGVRVLPPAEITFEGFPAGKPHIVGYDAKWSPESFEFRATVRRFEFATEDAPLLERLTELALRCWTLFSVRGWARVDFRVDSGGRPWILEVNANPCLSPDAGFAAAARRAGLGGTDVVAAISEAPRKQVLRRLGRATRTETSAARGRGAAVGR